MDPETRRDPVRGYRLAALAGSSSSSYIHFAPLSFPHVLCSTNIASSLHSARTGTINTHSMA